MDHAPAVDDLPHLLRAGDLWVDSHRGMRLDLTRAPGDPVS